MKSSIPQSPTRPPGLNAVVAGTACCVVSALGYAASHVCMRQLAALDADPMWVVCNKELVTVVAVGPWLLCRAFRGLPVLPPWRILLVLVLVGLAVQMGANLGVQWTLGVVGLAIAIPAVFGVMLTTSAAMGRVLLGERVSGRSTAAIGLLLGALALLGMAANAAGKSVSAGSGTLWVTLGVGTACLAGAIYATLMTTLRYAVTRTTSISTAVFTTTLMGVLTLGPLSLYRLTAEELLRTPPEQIMWMLAAGILNLIAFLAIAKGLQLTTVVHANLLNASQVAMAAVAGIAIFREPVTPWLIAGVSLTMLGVTMIDRPRNGDWVADQHA